MATYIFERLDNGNVKMTKDGDPIYLNGEATVDPQNTFIRIVPIDSPPFSIIIAEDTITNNGTPLTGTANAIAEVLATTTFFKPAGVTVDTSITNGSANAVSSNAVFDALALKANTADLDPTPLDILAMQALGSTIKGHTFGMTIMNVTTTCGISDEICYFVQTPLAKAGTITGARFFQVVQGNYTAASENRLALYTFANGTLTRVAMSADDGNLWKGAASTIQTAAFSATYAALAGPLYICYMLNYSAVTTGPTIGAGTPPLTGIHNIGEYANSAKTFGYIIASTPPASVAMSAITPVGILPYFEIY